MADLITKAEYKTLARIPTSDTNLDEAIDLLIPWVSDALRTVAGRQFGSDEETATRSFQYDGSGYLDIDDASEITEVAYAGSAIPTTLWASMPYEGSIFWWIELPPLRAGSAEMGFTRNEDVFGAPFSTTVEVTGTFGWTTIPNEVKMAAAWTLAAWLEGPRPFTTESIEGYSRTSPLPPGLNQAVPARAVSLLDFYDRGPQL